MTLLYYSPLYLEHNTGNHPENARRLQAVVERLKASGLWDRCSHPQWEAAGRERLESVHDSAYLASVVDFIAAGGGQIEVDTVVSRRSFDAAACAAGAACDAVSRVLQGEDKTAFCLQRPPGHHALADQAMGFCLLNHVALAARFAVTACGLERVLIVDWDVHHGNGTQAIFWEDASVGFLSMHRSPFYPFTGNENEIGAGAGVGTTRNIPVEFGTPRDKQLQRFTAELESFAAELRPQLILISAGFDSHKDDPVGSLGLEVEDFFQLTKVVLSVADEHANGQVVSILEGGYNPAALALCVETHLDTLLRADAVNR